MSTFEEMKKLADKTDKFFMERIDEGIKSNAMTGVEGWEKKAREQWGILVGPKSNQFDQEVALIKILRQLELDTIARCAETVRNSRTVNETYGVGLNETNARMQAIVDLTSLNKTI